MPLLGDYVGQLMSEITIARMQADIEAVRVAELYSSHPLLRHLPVPHFRLPNLEMDVPVVVKQMEELQVGKTPRGAPLLVEMRKVFDGTLARCLSEEGIRLKPVHRKNLKLALDKKMASLTQPVEIAVDVNRVAEGLVNATSLALTGTGGPVEPEKRMKLEDRLREITRVEFLKLRTPPTRLQVLVTTSEIREAGPSEVITRLHLKITEEAFEWTTIESDGEKQDRLVVE